MAKRTKKQAPPPKLKPLPIVDEVVIGGKTYITPEKLSERVNINRVSIMQWLIKDRVIGAVRFGRTWIIPADFKLRVLENNPLVRSHLSIEG